MTTDNLPQAEICERLPWDSQFFGFEVARLNGATLNADRLRDADLWCKQHKTALLYFLAQCDDATTVRSAEDGKFRMVDIRVTFERKADPLEAPPRPAQVRPFEPADLPALRRMSRGAYTDSRFYYDGRIPVEKCDDLFEKWTVSSCQGYADQVLVAHRERDAVGYVTCHIDHPAGCGSIGLIGVDPAWRGAGIGRDLVMAALNYTAQHGLARETVVTQGRNLGAQRLYQRCGFVTRSLQLYYHKWYE